MGFVSHKVERREIKPGDHIYTWRALFAYSHHGIYVGGNKVVHFTRVPNMDPSDCLSRSSYSSGSSIKLSASSLMVQSTCPNSPDCGFQQPDTGVVISCLDCFLSNGSLYRFEYGVIPLAFLAKLRGGTCTIAKSDPPQATIHKAMYMLHNGFRKYDVFRNNCEDFALYCKTGLLIIEKNAPGTSGQAACVIGAQLATLLASPLKLFMSNPVGFATTTATFYCWSRYATDIGVRTDAIKVKVEELTLLHRIDGPKENLAEDTTGCEGRVLFDQTDVPASKRQTCNVIDFESA